MCEISTARNNGLISTANETCGIESPYSFADHPNQVRPANRRSLFSGPADSLTGKENRQPALEELIDFLGWLHQARFEIGPGPRVQMREQRLCGGLRRYRGLRARSDCAIETSWEEAPLRCTCFSSQRKVKHLSSRPCRDQPIGDFDREESASPLRWVAEQVRAVQSCRRYLQSCNLCSYTWRHAPPQPREGMLPL